MMKNAKMKELRNVWKRRKITGRKNNRIKKINLDK